MLFPSLEDNIGAPAEPLVVTPERPAFRQALRTYAGVLADSALVVFLVVASALVLSTVEGVIRSREAAPPVMASDEQARAPWLNAVFGIKTAHAAPLKGYEAMQVQIPSKVTMAPGESKEVTVTFQNIGEKDWSNSGERFVSIYTYGPKYRTSVFQSGSWYRSDQPVKLSESAVKVGGKGSLTFTLKAPKTAGTYKETFNLAAENLAWIPGGEFTITIDVTGTSPTSTTGTSTSTSGHEAEVVATTAPSIKAKGGISVLYTVQVKNTGTTTWGARTLKSSDVKIAGVSTADFKHPSWKSSSVVVENSGTVKPGATDTFTFAFKTPNKKGNFTVSFQVEVDGESIEGGMINIPVEVTSGASTAKDAPKKKVKEKKTTKETASDGIVQNLVIDEPTIRVGILTVDEETDDEIVIRADESGMKVTDIDGKALAEVAKGKKVTAWYENGKYYYDLGDGEQVSKKALRFVPDLANSILTITNFDRKVTRGSRYSDNQFRNILEIRYNDTKDRIWMINELPMEWYLKGLAETSNDSHIEFQKTLIVSARTYAYYHWQRATKHDEEYYHVDAYYDQVYKGYGQELRTPKMSEAVDLTRGVTVTYKGETAITAYFSRSDGRTRDWSEVWGGSVPWSKSVAVPCDVGKTLWGHGVGMSASGALCMANDGDDYKKILHYFYTGIDLEKRWK